MFVPDRQQKRRYSEVQSSVSSKKMSHNDNDLDGLILKWVIFFCYNRVYNYSFPPYVVVSECSCIVQD